MRWSGDSGGVVTGAGQQQQQQHGMRVMHVKAHACRNNRSENNLPASKLQALTLSSITCGSLSSFARLNDVETSDRR